MFGLRFTSEAQKRSKNGQPPHKTTGAESASSDQCRAEVDIGRPSVSPNIPSSKTGRLSTAPTQNRLRMETYSGSGPTSPAATTSIGSSAIPHFGHEPGPY